MCGNQGGINDRALLHGHAALLEVGFHRLKDLLAKIVLLKQEPEGQDRRLVWNPVTDHVDASKPAHGWHLDQRLLHAWIAKAVPLLNQMNPQHVDQGIRRTATLLAIPGVVGFAQVDQHLPGHYLIHLIEKLLSLSALFGSGLLVIAVGVAFRAVVAKLIAAHQPSSDLGLQS